MEMFSLIIENIKVQKVQIQELIKLPVTFVLIYVYFCNMFTYKKFCVLCCTFYSSFPLGKASF